jgi:ribosomal protein L15E
MSAVGLRKSKTGRRSLAASSAQDCGVPSVVTRRSQRAGGSKNGEAFVIWIDRVKRGRFEAEEATEVVRCAATSFQRASSQQTL